VMELLPVASNPWMAMLEGVGNAGCHLLLQATEAEILGELHGIKSREFEFEVLGKGTARLESTRVIRQVASCSWYTFGRGRDRGRIA
jgi:hypothetical protein